MKNQLPPLAYIVLHCEIGVEVSLAIVYPIRNTRAPPGHILQLPEMEYFYYIGGFIYVYESYWKQKTPYPR